MHADTPVVFAVLTAAGSGTRLGMDMPKALVPVCGKPMLSHATRGLLDAGVSGIVITAPADHLAQFEAAVASHAATHTTPILVVSGGATRQASVAAGLAAIPAMAQACGIEVDEHTVVLVHDAARALTPPDMMRRVAHAVLRGSSAVIPALPVADTLKVIDRNLATEATLGAVSSTVDRSTLMAVQTPQGFPWPTISRAHDLAEQRSHDESLAATDDAGLVEAMGGQVDIVLGDATALKITTPWDLAIAELLSNNATTFTPGCAP